MRRSLASFLLALWVAGCAPQRTCGPGTRAAGSTCVPDVVDAAPRDAGPDPIDARTDVGVGSDATVDAGPIDAGVRSDATVDAAARTCTAACDCPADSVCTIDGTCAGEGCTRRCTTAVDCPCDRACVDGLCDFAVGSLTACEHTCDCPFGEVCGAGRCVRVCGAIGLRSCRTDVECEPCGTVCEPYGGRCTARGEGCSCDGSCSAWGYAAMICDRASRCAEPPGARLDLGGGELAMATPIGYRHFEARAATREAGTVTRATIVADLDIAIDDYVEVAVLAPDGTSSSHALSWDCAGAGITRWTAVVDLDGAARTGEWRVTLRLLPTIPTAHASVTDLWLFVE
jgi:hypothetical protein